MVQAGGEAGVGVGGEVEVWADPQYLLYALNISQAEIAITRIAAAVKVEDGR